MKKASQVIIRIREARVAMLATDDRNVRHRAALQYASELEEPAAEVEGLIERIWRTARRETEGQRRRGRTES